MNKTIRPAKNTGKQANTPIPWDRNRTIQLVAGAMDILKAAKIEPGVGCIRDVKVLLLLEKEKITMPTKKQGSTSH